MLFSRLLVSISAGIMWEKQADRSAMCCCVLASSLSSEVRAMPAGISSAGGKSAATCRPPVSSSTTTLMESASISGIGTATTNTVAESFGSAYGSMPALYQRGDCDTCASRSRMRQASVPVGTCPSSSPSGSCKNEARAGMRSNCSLKCSSMYASFRMSRTEPVPGPSWLWYIHQSQMVLTERKATHATKDPGTCSIGASSHATLARRSHNGHRFSLSSLWGGLCTQARSQPVHHRLIVSKQGRAGKARPPVGETFLQHRSGARGQMGVIKHNDRLSFVKRHRRLDHAIGRQMVRWGGAGWLRRGQHIHLVACLCFDAIFSRPGLLIPHVNHRIEQTGGINPTRQQAGNDPLFSPVIASNGPPQKDQIIHVPRSFLPSFSPVRRMREASGAIRCNHARRAFISDSWEGPRSRQAVRAFAMIRR